MKTRLITFAIIISSLTCYNSIHAQVIKSFTQRTSAASPNKLIYNIKGDYTMIGNTNLTLQSYNNTTNNSNNMMIYVDADSDTSTFNSSSATLEFSNENGAIPSCSNIIYAGLYWTGRASNTSSSPETFTVSKNGKSKSFNKRTVQLKGPGQSNYTQFVANAGNIYYPDGVYGNMYSAYVEITPYVKANGLGEYTVADIALIEGNGGTTGYYGGWGIIVVYENSKMNWRDVTIFDGHAYVVGNTTINYELPVNGFHTVQNGQVNMKLGMMAGEGDVGIPGDYFKIRNWQDNNWITLNHSGNTTTNFFNGSVNTGGNPRNPNLQNNTGLDIAMFNIPNAGNSVITNNQTSTRFQYGSTQDTYIIFCIAMAVDAYIPDVESIISTETINGAPVGSGPLTAQPGQDIEYKLQVKNLGTEAIDNTKFVIPIPYTTSYVTNSISTSINFAPAPVPNNAYYDSTAGLTGSIIWDFGTLPLPPVGFPDSVLAELTFHFTVTNDCNILKNPDCPPTVTLSGATSSGTGAISGSSFNMPFIQGYQTSGGCAGEPITDPLQIAIDATNFIATNCQNTPTTRSFVFCNYTLPTIPVTSIASGFPAGLRFFNTNNITPTSIEYDSINPFPALAGTHTYFAIPVGLNLCYYTFSISVSNLTSTPTAHDTIYCLNSTAIPLNAIPSDTSYSIVYYTSLNSNIPLTTITPTTSAIGSTTYYAAEKEPASLGGCISPNRIPINVSVYDLSLSLSSQNNVLCFGDSTGSATISANGGSGNYVYQWNSNPIQTSATANGLSANTYTVTVTDTSGCPVPSTMSITITQPTNPLSASISSQTNILCKGANTGSASISASGGSGSYIYSWNTTPTQDSSTAINLYAMTYTVTVSDSNGCNVPVTASVTISEPNASISASINSQSTILCKGDSSAWATVLASGGSGNYIYSWSTIPTQVNDTAINLSAGTYTVIVSDNNGCTQTVTSTVIITEPDSVLKGNINSFTNVYCHGDSTGSASISVTGGSGNYSYSWNTNPVQNTATASNLPIGTYIVNVSDNNGCTKTISDTITITEPSNALSATITAQTNIKCVWTNTGSATVTASGGSGNYAYSWNTTPVQTNATANNLAANTYTVTITDNNGCNKPVTATVTITQPQFELGVYQVSQNNILCFGDSSGSASVQGIGGSGGYNYSWNSNPIQTGQTATGLPAGNYTVTVSDTNGCSIPSTLTVSITQPTTPLGGTITSQTNVLCNGYQTGTATVSAIGGSGIYNYSWNTSPAQPNATAVGLSAGNYTVTISDNNGCTKTITAVATITQPQPISLTHTTSDAICDKVNGSIDLTVSGGVSPYQYLWSTSDTTQDISNLNGGTYQVTITDKNGCIAFQNITVNQTYLNISLYSPTYFGGFNLSGYQSGDGSIDLTINGSSPPYTINWSSNVSSEDISNAPAGFYTVSVTDSKGCSATASILLTEPMMFEMPNGISPNNDGKNDYFVVHGLEISNSNQITVFNRWGNIVYQAENYKNDWQGNNNNGEALPDGTYFVIMEIKDKNVTLKGFVEIRK